MGVPERVERPPFAGRRVFLGITGGIAAYKSIGLARELTLAGAQVDVCFSESAHHFVTPLSFEAITGRPVHTSMYEPGEPLLHIQLARDAELIVVAPATANFMARAAAGMADDLMTAVLLAAEAPVLVCPAMNDRMFAHTQTQANLARLREIGYRIAGPAEGPLAWGEGTGLGRMIEPATILDHIGRELTGRTPLTGLRVLITAGPTREAIDPVRYIGNRSSGKMGYALAAEAWRMGAEVVLVSGPSVLDPPTGVTVRRVESAAQMLDAVSAEVRDADLLVMAAAIADFRPADPAEQKIKKGESAPDTIELEATADVLRSTIDKRKKNAVVVGFALETEDAVENGRQKMEAKKLDLLVANDATEDGAGFEVDTNRVILLDPAGGRDDLPLLSKTAVATRILERAAELLGERQ